MCFNPSHGKVLFLGGGQDSFYFSGPISGICPLKALFLFGDQSLEPSYLRLSLSAIRYVQPKYETHQKTALKVNLILAPAFNLYGLNHYQITPPAIVRWWRVLSIFISATCTPRPLFLSDYEGQVASLLITFHVAVDSAQAPTRSITGFSYIWTCWNRWEPLRSQRSWGSYPSQKNSAWRWALVTTGCYLVGRQTLSFPQTALQARAMTISDCRNKANCPQYIYHK